MLSLYVEMQQSNILIFSCMFDFSCYTSIYCRFKYI